MSRHDEPDAGDGGAGAPPDTHESNKAPDLTREYGNDDLIVRWYAKRCIHSAECIRLAPRAFDPRRRPWVDLAGESRERIVAAVEACPTGALEYALPDREEAAADTLEIRIVRDGPLFVRGRLNITNDDGTVREMKRAAFCRCGKSTNQPFCDNSHRATPP